MFTGLIDDQAIIRSVQKKEEEWQWALAFEKASVQHCVIGQSIAFDGCCLTVTAVEADQFFVSLSQETLEKTRFGDCVVGERLNVEWPLKVGEALDGHFVMGHVDGVVAVESIRYMGKHADLSLRPLNNGLMDMISPKGSVALNGVSLTVNQVHEHVFTCHLIPHTLAVTNLAQISENSVLNMEVDCIARYLHHLHARRACV